MTPLLPLLFACRQAPDPGGDAEVATAGDDTWQPLAMDSGDPVLTADEATALIGRFFARGVTNPRSVALAFLEWLSQGDEGCPGGPTTVNALGGNGCTSMSGWTYSGIGGYLEERTEPYPLGSWMMVCDFDLNSPEGDHFVAGGEISTEVTADGDGYHWTSDYHGSYVDETRDNWLGLGTSVMLLSDGHISDTGLRSLDLHGGAQVGAVALYFDDLHLDEATCGGVPWGTVLVRDVDGRWTTLELSDDCSGCGPVVFDDRIELGDACLVDAAEVGSEILDAWVPW